MRKGSGCLFSSLANVRVSPPHPHIPQSPHLLCYGRFFSVIPTSEDKRLPSPSSLCHDCQSREWGCGGHYCSFRRRCFSKHAEQVLPAKTGTASFNYPEAISASVSCWRESLIQNCKALLKKRENFRNPG